MVFAGARVCFVGFPEDETQHMAEVLASNGGSTCQMDDPDCSHVVSTHLYTFYTTTLSKHTQHPHFFYLYSTVAFISKLNMFEFLIMLIHTVTLKFLLLLLHHTEM